MFVVLKHILGVIQVPQVKMFTDDCRFVTEVTMT
jgi:hypothetical protein